MTTTHVAKPKSFLMVAAPLFLVLFIDSMGLGLVFPILNALVIDPGSTFIPASTSDAARNLIYGGIVSIFMFCWFFGAAFLGDLSDQIGRKKCLLICLVGSFFGYLFSALAVTLGSITMLVIGRIVAGITAGSQSIAQAAIIDISTEEHKARNLGLMLTVLSVGFIFGPLAGGVLSNQDLSSNFTFATPFYFAAFISFINVILLVAYFKETFVITDKVSLQWHKAISIFISAFTNIHVRELSVVFFVMIFGWSGFYSFISMFLLKAYHFTPLNVSLYMCVLGAGFGIGTGFLIEPLTQRFSLKSCVIGGLLIAAAASLATLIIHNQLVAWLMALPVGMTMAMAYSVILTIFSNQVDDDHQGWVMGITGAIMAFAFALNALVIGELASIDIRIPLAVAAGGIFLSAVLMTLLYKDAGKQ